VRSLTANGRESSEKQECRRLAAIDGRTSGSFTYLTGWTVHSVISTYIRPRREQGSGQRRESSPKQT
jgi:hypothetical protein